MTRPTDLLAAAWQVLDGTEHDALTRRRAISTAYYALFHAMCTLCADTLLPDADRSSDEYLRTYRALDHGPLKTLVQQTPIKEAPDLSKIAATVAVLQRARVDADYLPLDLDVFPPDAARQLLDQCRSTLASISALALAERRLLATSLLFRTR